MRKEDFWILLDNGHGKDTKGKCSPCGTLKEWHNARCLVHRLEMELKARGYNVYIVTWEEEDVSLSVRTRRVNDFCKRYGKENCVLISMHNDACGSDSQWHEARGFSPWVSVKNASSNSKLLASLLWEEALKNDDIKGNRSVPKEKYKEGNYAIVRDTHCAAVLTENLFQDNKEDVEYLLSEEGKVAIANMHADAIERYFAVLSSQDE